MVYLLDTNILIRFLVGDHEEQLRQSIDIFGKIERAQLQVEILEGVVMEAFFVLTKFYEIPTEEAVDDLKTILSLNGVVNTDKTILHEALSIVVAKNIDFVDALICAKCKLQGYEMLSFDKDLKKC